MITEIPVIALPTKAYYKWCAPSCFVPGDPGKPEAAYVDFVHKGVGVINSVNVKIQPGERPFDIERGCFITTLRNINNRSLLADNGPTETFTISGLEPIKMTVHNEMEYVWVDLEIGTDESKEVQSFLTKAVEDYDITKLKKRFQALPKT